MRSGNIKDDYELSEVDWTDFDKGLIEEGLNHQHQDSLSLFGERGYRSRRMGLSDEN